ncbi:hypothetical protein BGW38_002279, partial [Lunasporangiospora selenospora]
MGLVKTWGRTPAITPMVTPLDQLGTFDLRTHHQQRCRRLSVTFIWDRGQFLVHSVDTLSRILWPWPLILGSNVYKIIAWILCLAEPLMKVLMSNS